MIKANYYRFSLFFLLLLFLLNCSEDAHKAVPQSFRTPRYIEGFKRMLHIPAGQFLMGDAAGFPNEQPLRQVYMPDFYMDEMPVTYQDFEAYVAAGGEKTAYWNYESYNQPLQPVTGISWYQAVDFCNWRSKREGLQAAYVKTDSLDAWYYPVWKLQAHANGYRLPTEAEFEYAARGGLKEKKYPWGDNFDDTYANYDTGRGVKVAGWWRLAKVNEGKKNAYGLYTMSGNVWQWCNNWYAAYAVKDSINPQGVETGKVKSLRGGSWGSIDPSYLRVASRSYSAPSNYNYDIGFRCVRSVFADMPDSMEVLPQFQHEYYRYPRVPPPNRATSWDFQSTAFADSLALFIGDHFANSIYFHSQVDQQEVTTPEQLVADILEVCQAYKVNPLFLTSIMISESGFGTCSFPRWYNNPMAYHWQNRLMPKGLPTYKDLPNRRNRKYKTLKDAFRAFCKGIRRPLYYKAAAKDLDAFHRIYVGYRADEWMHTLSRVYRDVVGMRFEAKYPPENSGKFIYTDWVDR